MKQDSMDDSVSCQTKQKFRINSLEAVAAMKYQNRIVCQSKFSGQLLCHVSRSETKSINQITRKKKL